MKNGNPTSQLLSAFASGLVSALGSTLILAVLMSIGLGCGKQNSPTDVPGGGTNAPGSLMEPSTSNPDLRCETAWNNHVAANPRGLLHEYRTETHFIVMGTDRVTSRSSRTEEVTVSDSTQVTTVTRTDQVTDTTTLTRDEFITSCLKGSEAGGGMGGGMEIKILEQGRRSVKVPAGTFDCAWMKSQIKTNVTSPGSTDPAEGIQETWIADGVKFSPLVKMTMTTVTKQRGQEFTTRIVTELVRFVSP